MRFASSRSEHQLCIVLYIHLRKEVLIDRKDFLWFCNRLEQHVSKQISVFIYEMIGASYAVMLCTYKH